MYLFPLYLPLTLTLDVVSVRKPVRSLITGDYYFDRRDDGEIVVEPCPFPQELQVEGVTAVLYWSEEDTAYYTTPDKEGAENPCVISLRLGEGVEKGPFGLVIKDLVEEIRPAGWSPLPPRLTPEEETLLRGEQLVRFRVQTSRGQRFLVQGGRRNRWMGEEEGWWETEWETKGPLVSSRQVVRSGWQAARAKTIRWDKEGGGVVWDEAD